VIRSLEIYSSGEEVISVDIEKLERPIEPASAVAKGS
jgi:hypothetical protein